MPSRARARAGDKLGEHPLFKAAPPDAGRTPDLTQHPVQNCLTCSMLGAATGAGAGDTIQQSGAKPANPFFASAGGGTNHVGMILLALMPLVNTWTVELVR